MPVTAADFWIVDEKADPWSSDPWATSLTEVLDSARLTALISTPGPEHADLDIALALMDLVRDDLQLSGTSGGERISDGNMRLAVRALERASARAGYEFKLPLRDHAGWRSYWIRKGASGSGRWQARRDLLSDLFDRQLNAALHLVAVTQARMPRSAGHAYVQRNSPKARPATKHCTA